MSLFHEVRLPESPGRFLLHSMPGRFESLDEFVAAANREQVSTILCIVSDAEIARSSPQYLGWLSTDGKAKRVPGEPIEDYGIPEDMEAFRMTLDTLAGRLNAGRTILIHCAAGVGRTGMVAACLLGKLGFEHGEALKRVYDAHSEPETEEQREFVRRYLREVAEREEREGG